MRRLSEAGLPKLVELLRERMAFEHTCVRLYDVLLERVATEEPAIARIAARVQLHRDEEAAHVAWLEGELQTLGTDLSAASAQAELVRRELNGLEGVAVEDNAIPSRQMHALLAAELANEAGWELLVRLAAAARDEPARIAFEKRWQCEQRHSTYLRRALDALTRNDVLGQPVTLPVDS